MARSSKSVNGLDRDTQAPSPGSYVPLVSLEEGAGPNL